jgi:hypothetical protein
LKHKVAVSTRRKHKVAVSAGGSPGDLGSVPAFRYGEARGRRAPTISGGGTRNQKKTRLD